MKYSKMLKNNIFFEILQVAIGVRSELSYVPLASEWYVIFRQANKQALIGISFYGLQKLPKEQICNIPTQLKMQWLGMAVQFQRKNDVLDLRCRELQSLLSSMGLRSCILKGQGVAALYYDNIKSTGSIGSFRQAGDIDVWVDGNINEVVRVLQRNNIKLESINSVHADAYFFKDIHVEVHFRPSWFFNPYTNYKFTKWITQNKNFQMSHESNGIIVPVIEFNIVYLLLHIYRHLFNEGIGLRQVMDYFMVLRSASDDFQKIKKSAYVIRSLGMERFACALSWVMQEVFYGNDNVDNSILELFEGIMMFSQFFSPDEKEGRVLLFEILEGGNFGKFDSRVKHSPKGIWTSGVASLKRNFKFLSNYHSEIIWMPYWKLWHWGWRKIKGYL